MQKLNQPLSIRSATWIIGVLLVVAAAVAGGRFAWQKYRSRPVSVAGTKETIRDYLKEQAGVSKFQPLELDAVSTNQPVAEAPQPTNAAATTAKVKEKKKKKPRSEHEEMAHQFRHKVKTAGDYKTIYRLIGENLARTDKLLDAHDSKDKREALMLAAEASEAALERAVNAGIAARIAEAYIWPNLDYASASGKNGTDAESLLDVCEKAFKAAGETDNLNRNYRLLISNAKSPDKADKFRLRLAKLLESKQNSAEARRILQEVQNTNDVSFIRRMEKLQQGNTTN